MVGNLSQLVTLVSHGNLFLTGKSKLENFYPGNSAFIYCNSVVFVDDKKFLRTTETEIAENPTQWLSWLKNNHCRKLALGYAPSNNPEFPDHMSVAFVGGGGRWMMFSIFSKLADYWLERWQVTNIDAPDRRIWKVTYGRVARNKPAPALPDDSLSSFKAELESVLKQIEVFAREHDLDHFAKCFRDGLDALESTDPLNLGWQKDLLPSEGLSLQATQLMGAACIAWVFGGMGSWNDLGFDHNEEGDYQRLSKQLYSIINRSVEHSVNSFA